jgi:pectate lyase
LPGNRFGLRGDSVGETRAESLGESCRRAQEYVMDRLPFRSTLVVGVVSVTAVVAVVAAASYWGDPQHGRPDPADQGPQSAAAAAGAGAGVKGSAGSPTPAGTATPAGKALEEVSKAASPAPTPKAGGAASSGTTPSSPNGAATRAPAGRSTLERADGFAATSGGTTGGAAGATVTVRTAAQLAKYASATKPYRIKVSGVISLRGQVTVRSNKTVIGAERGAGISGGGLDVRSASNVIIAGLTMSKPVGTDSISVYASRRVLITHNEFSSDRDHGKDYYDGLVDITKGSDLVTVSWNVFHDHAKVMLISAGDDDGDVDTGRERVTIHHNWFRDFGSRTPSLRFGTGHVYNNLFEAGDTGVHSRMGARILMQANTFRGVRKPAMTTGGSDEDGFVTLDGKHPNDAGGAILPGRKGSAFSLPYRYAVAPVATVPAVVKAGAGPI